MEIEIAEPARMAQTGSSLLKLIQNNNMPALDLLVRESVQNSLDAGKKDTRAVRVDFISNEFRSREFNSELKIIGDRLNQRFPGDHNKFLAVCDRNTVGLTGTMSYDDVSDERHYGNLLKLVYEISKPQNAEGAGGSWGLGKTVYFRIGIGLVVYYSRIRTDDGYASRMAVSLVEDETSRDAMLPPYRPGKLRRGIAWWGEGDGQNKTRPVTDEKTIARVLDEFHLSPYSGQDTGTVIIIPYIDENRLLHNNEVEYFDSDENLLSVPWRKSLCDYLRISVQRWYAPRINNIKYPYGKYLQVFINGRPITTDSMEPPFRIVQDLYNWANGNSKPSYLDEEEVRSNEIRLRGTFVSDTRSGTVAFVRVSRDILRMNPPYNKRDPYMYFNCERKQADTNKSVICFTRKPGMIVSYETVGAWADGLPESDSDHYIIAVFVINSGNRLRGADLSLEEYVRKSEMADHTDWNDYNFDGINPRVITKSQKQIAGKIFKEFASEDREEKEVSDNGLGKLFGDLLLPPENFGKKPGPQHEKEKKPSQSYRHIRLTIDGDVEYRSGKIIYPLHLTSTKKVNECEVRLGIESESGNISPEEWTEKLGLKMPFVIESIRSDGKAGSSVFFPVPKMSKDLEKSGAEFIQENGEYVGFAVSCPDPEKKIDLRFNMSVLVREKDFNPAFILREQEDD